MPSVSWMQKGIDKMDQDGSDVILPEEWYIMAEWSNAVRVFHGGIGIMDPGSDQEKRYIEYLVKKYLLN